MTSPIARYLADLRHELRHDPLLARRVCEEAADHLAEIAAEERRRGMTPMDSEQHAVDRFGPAGALARRFTPFAWPLKALLAAAGLATALVALWLFTVVVTVLPSRDPSHAGMWTGIAWAFLAYAAISLAFVVRGPRPALLPALVVAGSLGAIGFGGYAIVSTWNAAHFEGYLVLMGLILVGHGACALAYTALTAVIARRVHSM